MRAYVDVFGNLAERPADAPVRWRVSCYPVAVREGRILLVEPAWARRWELPGGGVELEREETLIEAAVRECREETGYRFVPDAASLAFAGEHFFAVPWSGAFYHSLTFTVRGTVAGEPDPGWIADTEEIVDIQWLDPAALTAERVQGFHWSALQSLGLAR
jgi:8-oxo-dGTP pyrophosphatase MutT (NUDIX family)